LTGLQPCLLPKTDVMMLPPDELDTRVVVTGVGLVTPFGRDRESSWQGLLSGRSATRWLDDENHPGHTWAGAPMAIGVSSSEKQTDPVVQLALDASREAVADAGLVLESEDRTRVGCVIGTSKGGLASFARAYRSLTMTNEKDFPAEVWRQFQPNAPAACVSRTFDLRGPSLCMVAACATGLANLVRGAELIRDGHCDVVLAGSSDASLHAAVQAPFHRMGVLARGFDDPANACRPFDQQRNGFVVGEGAGVLVMERADRATARGATAYAEWVTGGSAADISGITRLEEDATGLSTLIQSVLKRAKLTSAEIDYANLHGTATRANDVCETHALHAAFGPAARDVRCSGLKGAIGHLLGAAGSVETAATLLAMRDGLIPPTVNLNEQDAACDLDYTPRNAQPRRIENALKVSLGFGGHLVAAVLREVTSSGGLSARAGENHHALSRPRHADR